MLISYKTIGRNIRAARKATGLTQEQTAKLMGISILHYGRLERGERPASLEQIAQAAKLLKTPLIQLLKDCAQDEDFGVSPSSEALTIGQEAAKIAGGCSAEAQKLMLALLRTVAEHDRA